MKKIVFVAVLAFCLWMFFSEPSPISHPAGILVNAVPKQDNLISPRTFIHQDNVITELAHFDITARVLAKKKYRLDRAADVSPVDLALGWGKMSDESVLAQIKISQSSRWYYWRVQQFPIPRREIEKSSANMHIIPADDHVRYMLSQVREGDIIEIQGSLVNVDSINEGWSWKTSLTRDDTGNAGCEIIWVNSLNIVTEHI